MSNISTLNSLPATNLNQASALPPAKQPENSDDQTDANGTKSVYGPAYVLSISDAGQAYINSDASSTSVGNATAAPATTSASQDAGAEKSSDDASPTSANGASGQASSSKGAGSPPAGAAGGGASASLESSLEEESKQKVRPQVGPTGADEVVDKQGNINETKLKELLAQQEQQAHRFDVQPTTKS